MPRRKKEEICQHLSGAELKQYVADWEARRTQVFNLEYLLTSAVDHARKIKRRNDSPKLCKEMGLTAGLPDNNSVVNERSSDWKRLRSLAGSVLTWAQQLQSAIDADETKKVAVFALKLGAAAQEMELIDQVMFHDWPTPSEAAKLLGVPPPEVSKLIAAGELKTNGGSGKSRRRLNPMSILRRLKEQGKFSDPDEATIAQRTAAVQELWTEEERTSHTADYDSINLERFVSPDDNS